LGNWPDVNYYWYFSGGVLPGNSARLTKLFQNEELNFEQYRREFLISNAQRGLYRNEQAPDTGSIADGLESCQSV